MQFIDWVFPTIAAVAALATLIHSGRTKRELVRIKQRYAQVLAQIAQDNTKPNEPVEEPMPVVIVTPPEPPRPVVHEIQLRGLGQDLPIASLRRTSHATWNAAMPMPLSNRRLASMAGIVEHAPSLALSAVTAMNDFYEVTFSDATALRMAVGDAAMQQATGGGLRAVAIDSSTGKILEHGTLHDMWWLNAAGFATAAWTILTVVVGKKYLADISTRLDAIATDVQSIKSLMENEMEGWLQGTAITLKRHLRELQDDAVSSSYASALLADCLQISREARHRWKSLNLSYGNARAGLEELMSGRIMSEDDVLRTAGAVQLLHSRAAALDIATQICAGCEHLRSSLGLSTVEGADELTKLADAAEALRVSEGELLKKLNTQLLGGDRPLIIGREKFNQAQRSGFESANSLQSAELTGHTYCEIVANQIRSGLLPGKQITVLLRRMATGEVSEARILTQSVQ